MHWKNLEEKRQLEEIRRISKDDPVLIFKHSTRCNVSTMALSRLERKWTDNKIITYFLDLLANRDVSNGVANEFGVKHESPQALLIKAGRVVYHSSHNGIDFDEINSIAKDSEAV